MNIGVFANDPGGASGLAWGIFDPGARDIAECLATRMLPGSTTVTGTAREQIEWISTLWSDFYNSCVRSALLPPERVFYVCEDFVFAPGVNYEGESARISTQIIWGIEGYRMGRAYEFRRLRRGGQVHVPPMYLQTASSVKSYATNKRLKEWGIWVVGRDHERSAWQHIAYFLAQYMRHNR